MISYSISCILLICYFFNCTCIWWLDVLYCQNTFSSTERMTYPTCNNWIIVSLKGIILVIQRISDPRVLFILLQKGLLCSFWIKVTPWLWLLPSGNVMMFSLSSFLCLYFRVIIVLSSIVYAIKGVSLCACFKWCRGNYTKHLDKVLEEAAAEFHPNIKFMRVSNIWLLKRIYLLPFI